MTTRRGVTLVELLMVIAVIAALAAILFPVFARARERARSHSCTLNLVNMGVALQLYASDHGGSYPPTEDDLSPLIRRYLRNDLVFTCPSAANPTTPMGAPANRSLSPPAPPEMGPPLPPKSNEAGAAPAAMTSYYYRAGHTPNEAPAAPLVSDQDLAHNGHANVLFSDGSLKRPAEAEWRGYGFRPLGEVWPPAAQTPPGMMPGTMPGMGGPPGGPPRKASGGGSP